MKTIKLLFKISVFSILSLAFCGSSIISFRNGSIPTINYSEFLTIEKSISKLSTIAERITYIGLKTPQNVVVGRILFIKFSKDKIIIVDQTFTIFVFDNDGNLIFNFNHMGRGPGEYLNIADIAFDAQNKILAIASDDTKKAYFYDLNGKFLNEVKFNFTPVGIHYLGNSLFLIKLCPIFPKNENEILSSLVINERGEIIQKHMYNVKEKSGPNFAIRFEGSIDNSKDGPIIFEPFNDTIYLVTKEGLRKPYLINNLGKYKAPREAYEGLQFYPKYGSQYFSLPQIFCFNDYVLTTFRFNSLTYKGLYDLKNNQYYLYEKTRITAGLIDDIDSGPSFIIAKTIYENNIVDLLEPSKLINDKSISPKKKTLLYTLMSGIKETDNPIIRIIKTKTNIIP